MNKLLARIALVLVGFASLTIPAKAQSADGLSSSWPPAKRFPPANTKLRVSAMTNHESCC